MGVNLIIYPSLKLILISLAFIAGIFVIGTKNAIISVFNLIVLYILVAFYLIYMGITYLGISYIIVYIGAIAILFLFVIMMIDVEIIEKKSNNYLPLFFLLLGGFIISLKKILYNIGVIKIKSLWYEKQDTFLIDCANETLFYTFNKDALRQLDINDINNPPPPSIIDINNPPPSSNIDIWDSPEDVDEDPDDLEITDLLNEFLDNHKDNVFMSETEVIIDRDRLLIWLRDIILEEENKDNEMTIDNNTSVLDDKNNEENNSTLLGEDHIELEEDYIKLDEDDIELNLDVNKLLEKWDLIDFNKFQVEKLPMPKLNDLIGIPAYNDNNYLLILPNWDSAMNRITQISAIGDVLYSVYHSYIYIVSVILLLGMIGAIILTAESNIKRRVMNIRKPKMKTSNVFSVLYIFVEVLNIIRFKYYSNFKEKYLNKYKKYKGAKNSVNWNKEYPLHNTVSGYIPLFLVNNNNIHSEDILGNLLYFIISNVFIGLLLLVINSFFSLSVKYLEKGGGFECGFTSFLQTRERYSIIFYRVSLLFLVFDLEIILIFPYPALYQKNQNISKNNVLAFLYILIVGFIYELKEGALNIVKKAHSTEINIKD